MEDVADLSIRKARDNLSKWEDLGKPLAPLSIEERETVIELSNVASSRMFPDLISGPPQFDDANSSMVDIVAEPIHSASEVNYGYNLSYVAASL